MFLIYSETEKGYLMDDEDRMFSYSPIIDEFTVKFDTRENAERNCEKGEIVIEITDNQ